MDKNELDEKITEMAKSILSYCAARTSNRYEAEDLAQDIIVQMYKSAESIRNINAFYGFMWAVAGNVYRQWYKKHLKNKECKLNDDLYDELFIFNDDSSDIYLLRRELSLLNEKYRKAVILYYMDDLSCSEISERLSISESMVKYLLFKSRQLLKEGMNMERTYGEQSYNPKEMSLLYWGNGENRYFHLCDSKISQNILFACYNDKLTAEQISLEIGVSLPYMEDKLKELYDYELLKKDGNRYYTNIVIFTKDFSNEAAVKTAGIRECISEIIIRAIEKNETEIRKIGFAGCDMSINTFAWQMTCIILYNAVVETLQNKIKFVCPKDKFGTECFVWGVENSETDVWKSGFAFGISNMVSAAGDYIQFMDFPINNIITHDYFYERENIKNIFFDIARGNTMHFSDNDKATAAEMIQKGYVRKDKTGLHVNTPVFTRAEYQKLKEILQGSIIEIAEETENLMNTVIQIIKNHIPVHLKKYAKEMAYLRLFEDAISATVSNLVTNRYLIPYNGDLFIPTAYVVLK